MKVKICGLKRLEDINIVNKYPVDYIGFVFAPSKRRVSLEEAIELKAALNPSIRTVGVFVNEEPSVVNEIAAKCSLDIVQLHGDEDDEYIKNIKFPVWKSISVKDSNFYKEMELCTLSSGFVLDTYSNDAKGGTGKVFNWDLVKDVSKDKFIILAGGLNSSNVLTAIDKVSPSIIDVSSGVEEQGFKNEFKIQELLRKVKNYDIK